MSKQQNMILWVGLGLVMLYLFTDVNFRNSLFGRNGTGIGNKAANTIKNALGNKGKTTSSNTSPASSLTLDSFLGVPSTTGNTQSNTGNNGSVQLA